MAVDKLVDSDKLNACCEAEAAAIIAKGGGTAPLTYDFANNKGFADAIAAIPSGGSGYENHTIDFSLLSSTSTENILYQYIEECAGWAIYPADADNTSLDTIVIGPWYKRVEGYPSSTGKLPSFDGVTTPTGISLSYPTQYYINDQTYNAIRMRGNRPLKPAGDYVLKFYGIAK